MDVYLSKVNKLEIQQMYELPMDVLITNQALSGGNLMWINGILISFAGFSQTEDLINDQIEGNYRWVLLEYTFEMEQYKPFVNAVDLNREVPIFNMSHHPFYKEIASFINSQKDKN